ncbi:transmembrane protein 89 [Rhynchonycteris naso]
MLCAPSFPFLLLVLARSVPAHAWSRPLWYQVGLDLQPWGCQPNSLEGCRTSLGCPGHWMGVEMNPLYPVAGVTLSIPMILMISRKVLQRQRSRGTRSQLPQGTMDTPGPCKRRTLISDHALLLTVLHMLDAILLQIQGHLQHLATQQPMPIKGTATQSG